jgi:hypothetical protein
MDLRQWAQLHPAEWARLIEIAPLKRRDSQPTCDLGSARRRPSEHLLAPQACELLELPVYFEIGPVVVCSDRARRGCCPPRCVGTSSRSGARVAALAKPGEVAYSPFFLGSYSLGTPGLADGERPCRGLRAFPASTRGTPIRGVASPRGGNRACHPRDRYACDHRPGLGTPCLREPDDHVLLAPEVLEPDLRALRRRQSERRRGLSNCYTWHWPIPRGPSLAEKRQNEKNCRRPLRAPCAAAALTESTWTTGNLCIKSSNLLHRPHTLRRIESPRVLRRVQKVRRWSDGETGEVFQRSPRASGSDGSGARG